jgi:hypothetical protein
MADWPTKKNAAFTVTFPIYDNDGDLVSAAAALDSEVDKDGAGFADCSNEATEVGSSGVYKLALIQAEMNADVVTTITKTSTAGAKTAVNVMYTAIRQLIDLAFPTTSGRSLDVTATGAAGIDWANVENPTTAVNLSGTNIDVDQIVASVSGAVGSVTGAVGSVTGAVGSVAGNVGGNVVGSVASVTGAVGSVAGNVGGNVVGSVASVTGAVGSVTGAVGSVAAGGIAAASFAAGALDAAALAADAANEIADAILKRDIDQVEATAALHSLCTAVLKAVARIRDNAGTLEIYRTNGLTLHMSQTITTDGTLDPIDELTAGV